MSWLFMSITRCVVTSLDERSRFVGNPQRRGLEQPATNRPGYASVFLGAGMVGLTLGVGWGLRWLQAGVLSPRTVVGVASLLAGFVLVGLGLGRMGRRRGRWLRMAIRTGLVILVGVFVWTFSPALIATNVPPTIHHLTPAELGLIAREVMFDTGDGVELFGWYVAPTDGKVVVVRHGSGSTASDALPQAQVLVDNGYGVLVTDARGHGSSGGSAMDFGWYGDADIAAAVDFLVAQPEVDAEQIAVLGLSMGGEEAIGALGSEGRIAAVVAEGATARTDADKAWLVGEYGWRGWLQLRLEWLQYAFTDLLTAASKPDSLIRSAEATSTPILLITAGDALDEAHAARYIQAADRNVQLWTIPGAGHTQGLSVAPAAWEQKVVGFLETALR